MDLLQQQVTWYKIRHTTWIGKAYEKTPLGNVNKEKSHFSSYLCIILEVGTFFCIPCDLLLQKTYSSAVG